MHYFREKKSMPLHLAQINIAKCLAPLDSPIMAGFVSNLENMNALAEKSPGFIWRLKDGDGDATSIRIFDDDFLIVNMSVWSTREALFKYVYRSDHVGIFRRRKEWFEKMPVMHMALWYVEEGHPPDLAQGIERLIYLRENGETPYAFSFKKNFTADEALMTPPVRP